MTGLPLTGGCNCGAVRFEVTAPLVGASYCHCKRCQRRSGTAVGECPPGAGQLSNRRRKNKKTASRRGS